MKKLTRFGVSLDQHLLANFDRLIEGRKYTNRSEAIRDLVREALVKEAWGNPEERVAATVTLVYDHHTHALSDRINDVQHDYGELIVSSLHVHLDHHHCLEVIVLRGPASQIQTVADALGCIKGVMHSQLTLTTEGKGLA